MTAAHGGVAPDASVRVTAVPVELGRDVAVQAAAGEATVSGVDQDASQSGAGDAAAGLITQKSNIAMQPAPSAQFTRDD